MRETDVAFAQGADGDVGLRWVDLPVDDRRQPEYALWYSRVKRTKQIYASRALDDRVKYPPGDFNVHPKTIGEGIELTVERAFARAGDRWIEVFVEIDPDRLKEPDSRLDVRLFAPGANQPVASRSFRPQSRVGQVLVDLRSHSLEYARLEVLFVAGETRIGMAEVGLYAQPPARPLHMGERISVAIDVPEGHLRDAVYPLTFGVPFPAGAVWDVGRLRLVDRDGNAIPSQSEVTGRWGPEGAVKWVRFDALVRPGAGLFVEVDPAAPGSGGPPRPESKGLPGSGAATFEPLVVTESGGDVVIDTGAARYVLGKGPSPIKRIEMGGRTVATSDGTQGLYVVDQRGRTGIASAEDESVVVEARGPVAASVRFEGFYRDNQGEPMARHITRIEAYAGQPWVKVIHTLILTNDTNRVWFRDIGWELAVAPGANPRALFAYSRENPEGFIVHQLDSATPSAYVLQESHFRFGKGDNLFKVVKVSGAGEEAVLHRGEEMGDWAALVGEAGGLLASVRESARQHPKEFDVHADRMIIRLFSGRAGEELDFRFETLEKKWNLGPLTPSVRNRLQTSNAVGWSKTHEMIVSPLPAGAGGSDAAAVSLLNSRPIYGHVDPYWVYETKAMGPLHPKDAQRYPEAEALVDRVVSYWYNLAHEAHGLYGFVDYFSGPSFGGDLGRRYRLTYGLRSDLWNVYARSGERWIREFAEGTNRAYPDNYLAHWPAVGKVKGLYVQAEEGGKGEFPYYWEERTEPEISGSTNLNQFLYDYYLTGNRRAKDVIVQFADGLNLVWNPGLVQSQWRVLMLLRVLMQTYSLTWDPVLRARAEATMAFFYDPESDTGLTKDRPYHSSTYKTQTDIRVLIEAWDLFGTTPYYDMARRMAEYWLEAALGLPPDDYTFPMPVAGAFLFRYTQDASIIEVLKSNLRHAYVGASRSAWFLVPAYASFATEGISLVQSIFDEAEKHGVRNDAALLAYDDDNGKYPVSIVMDKGVYDVVKMDVIRNKVGDGYEDESGGVAVRYLGVLDYEGPDFVRVVSRLGVSPHTGYGHTEVEFAKDAKGGQYEIRPLGEGEKTILVRRYEPGLVNTASLFAHPYRWAEDTAVVLYAPKGLRLPSVAGRFYFNVPEKARAATLIVDGGVRLFDPEGNPVDGGRPVTGAYVLPQGKPGLWSFETASPGQKPLIRVINLPPFFSMNDANRYFEPMIPWIEWTRVPDPDEPVTGDLVIEFTVRGPSIMRIDDVELFAENRLLYRGRGASHSISVDTATLNDGLVTLTLRIRSGATTVEEQFGFRVANTWRLVDELEGPVRLFGRQVDRSLTSERSPGWTFEAGKAADFFGDASRMRRTADSTEYLVWDVAEDGFYAYAAEVYVRSEGGFDAGSVLAAVESAIQFSLAEGDSDWVVLPHAAIAADVSPAGWLKVVVSGKTRPHAASVRIKLTLKGGIIPEGAIELGKVTLTGTRVRE